MTEIPLYSEFQVGDLFVSDIDDRKWEVQKIARDYAYATLVGTDKTKKLSKVNRPNCLNVLRKWIKDEVVFKAMRPPE